MVERLRQQKQDIGSQLTATRREFRIHKNAKHNGVQAYGCHKCIVLESTIHAEEYQLARVREELEKLIQ